MITSKIGPVLTLQADLTDSVALFGVFDRRATELSRESAIEHWRIRGFRSTQKKIRRHDNSHEAGLKLRVTIGVVLSRSERWSMMIWKNACGIMYPTVAGCQLMNRDAALIRWGRLCMPRLGQMYITCNALVRVLMIYVSTCCCPKIDASACA